MLKKVSGIESDAKPQGLDWLDLVEAIVAHLLKFTPLGSTRRPKCTITIDLSVRLSASETCIDSRLTIHT